MSENWEQRGRLMAFDLMTAELADRIRLQAENAVRLIVATDSQPSLPIRFETVVILVIPGQIRAYNRRLATMGPMALAERMWTETAMSLMVAEAILADLTGRGIPVDRSAFELHVDVGENGESRTARQQAMGMVTGAGYAVKVKPESWAASRVADRLTKQDRKRPVLPVYELVTAI